MRRIAHLFPHNHSLAGQRERGRPPVASQTPFSTSIHVEVVLVRTSVRFRWLARRCTALPKAHSLCCHSALFFPTDEMRHSTALQNENCPCSIACEYELSYRSRLEIYSIVSASGRSSNHYRRHPIHPTQYMPSSLPSVAPQPLVPPQPAPSP